MSDAASIIERIGAEGIRTVDFRFTDLAGRWRHLGREAGGVDGELLAEGVFIDGSSIPGWREVTEADLLLRPDLATAFADPFAAGRAAAAAILHAIALTSGSPAPVA